jgi:hypothetical protein
MASVRTPAKMSQKETNFGTPAGREVVVWRLPADLTLSY